MTKTKEAQEQREVNNRTQDEDTESVSKIQKKNYKLQTRNQEAYQRLSQLAAVAKTSFEERNAQKTNAPVETENTAIRTLQSTTERTPYPTHHAVSYTSELPTGAHLPDRLKTKILFDQYVEFY